MKSKEFKTFIELVQGANMTSSIWIKKSWFDSLTGKQKEELLLILKHKPEVRKAEREGKMFYILPGGLEIEE